MLLQVPLTDAERAEIDARPEKLALGGAGGFQARSRPRCLVCHYKECQLTRQTFCCSATYIFCGVSGDANVGWPCCLVTALCV